MPEVATSVSSRIFYRKMGSGPVLVLSHGFPENGTIWRTIWNGLSSSFTLIIPDLPGSGNSVLEKETGIGEMADCIKSVMDNEGIKRAVIAGHSMGGYVGFEFAARYPERLAGLSLVHSIALADDEDKKRTRLKAIELIQKGGKDIFIRQMIPNLFSNVFKQSSSNMVEVQVERALKMDAASLVNFYDAMIARKDNSGILEKADYPVQWIIGMDDNVIYYKKILEQCYKSPVNFVSFYNNCGHMSMTEAPGQLFADLKEFTDYSYEYHKTR